MREDGEIEHLDIDPTELGFHTAHLEDLKGDDAPTNAAILRGVLDGSLTDSKRDVVLLNAGAAIMAAGAVDSIAGGIEVARESIDSGAAVKKLDDLIRFSQSLAS